MTFAEKAIRFHENLVDTGGKLPKDIRVMNPFKETPAALTFTRSFYTKYFNDSRKRHIILGINPGRLGAGLTGIPFTDPKRLQFNCAIPYEGKITHEPSSVFVYEMIDAFGGPDKFYRKFFINSPCPLGFTSVDKNGKEKNYNYYDSRELATGVTPFMIKSINELLQLGIHRNIAFCLGTGKNFRFLQQLNNRHQFFETIIPLEHPRYIMQYKNRSREAYIEKYLTAFSSLSQ